MNTLGHRVPPNTHDRHAPKRTSPIFHDYMARWEPVPLWRRVLKAVRKWKPCRKRAEKRAEVFG